jgi:hypothetical protein
VVATAERFEQNSLLVQGGNAGAGQPVAAGDVDSQQFAAGGAGGDSRRAADERVALRAAGERDDDPFAGFPRADDAVPLPVPLQSLFHAVGQP